MFQSIVVGTDGSATATEAVHRAYELAGLMSADLHIVSAYRPPAVVLAATAEPGLTPSALVQWSAAAGDDVHRLLDSLAAELCGPVTVTTHAVAGHPATAILSVAEAVAADLIVVGNRGMKGTRRVLGSIPNHVSHHAACNVLVVDTLAAVS
ncbi:MAG TPA: universal stress protein [Acidimicrobiia bacterium]|jgi:nucleotide-binding universal stress UspA family protein|nr:universal stress protein [Acidimicrobiia bacterium]